MKQYLNSPDWLWGNIRQKKKDFKTLKYNEVSAKPRQEENQTQICNVNIFLYSVRSTGRGVLRRGDSQDEKDFVNTINLSYQFSQSSACTG